ncbi:MAG: DUF2306 domain-containing protein [Actinomycetota bacterium]
MPVMVLAFYGALVIWAGMLAMALRTSTYRNFLWFGIGLMVFLNLGYFIRGQGDAIAFFVSLYDVLDNLGVSAGEELPAALATCPDNACSQWGDTYDAHPAWGVAFHERFADGPSTRKGLLYVHIAFNSIALILAHVQLARPGTGGAANAARHRMIGRIGFGAVTLGTLAAVLLAGEHTTVDEYGGAWATLGFWFMSLCVYGCAVPTVLTARRGDIASHRVWTIRYLGAMWGAFWLFRVMLFVLDPLLRNIESAAILICIWFSAPLGILIAERFRTRRRTKIDVRPEEPTPASV